MDALRVAPALGIVGCLGALGTLVAPYLFVDNAGLGAYYGSGAIHPFVAGVFALVALIALAAGREGRTDPGVAAGAGLALGAFVVGIALAWGLTVRIDAAAVPEYHRWVLVGVAALVPAGSAWFARALGVF